MARLCTVEPGALSQRLREGRGKKKNPGGGLLGFLPEAQETGAPEDNHLLANILKIWT